MDRTDEQIDLIVRARDIMLRRAGYYTERARVTENEIQHQMFIFAAAYGSAASILTEALNENTEVLREYEGA